MAKQATVRMLEDMDDRELLLVVAKNAQIQTKYLGQIASYSRSLTLGVGLLMVLVVFVLVANR